MGLGQSENSKVSFFFFYPLCLLDIIVWVTPCLSFSHNRKKTLLTRQHLPNSFHLQVHFHHPLPNCKLYFFSFSTSTLFLFHDIFLTLLCSTIFIKILSCHIISFNGTFIVRRKHHHRFGANIHILLFSI